MDGDELMTQKKMNRSSYAVAGVIEALLLVALFSVVLSMIQLIYIPEIMEQREGEHMDEVENQFSQLKSIIDMQSIVKEDLPISSAITLGSRELPYFVTVKAFGALSVVDDSENYIQINDSSEIINLNTIQFQSYNAYYFNQFYVLEGGGVLLRQDDEGEAMKIHPPITFERQTNGGNTTVFLNWTIHNFTTNIGGKDTAEGYKSCFIRTLYTDTETKIYHNISSLNIFTNYVGAWNQSIIWLLNQHNVDSYVNVSKHDTNITIEPNNAQQVNIIVRMEIIYINVQIGKGTVVEYLQD